ncbi:MAG: Na+/H+ antiporter NhaA [Steroidobacteraceae bacterium]
MPPRTEALITRALATLQDFLRLEAAGGLLLMAAAVLALLVANSPLAGIYTAFLELPVEARVGALGISKPMILWINDGLMAVFFLLVGLELKREILEGHLSSLRDAALPAFAAIGGMAVPAAIYAGFNWGDAAAMKGWAIPSATDIAFALGVLMLLGERVPAALKAFLLSVAIFDDIGAIIIIAAFYTAELSPIALAAALGLTALLALLNRAGITRRAAYVLVGLALWFALLKSGVHATLAGVVLALFIPLRPPDTRPGQSSPLHEFEQALHPWVAFGVLPVFAFANAGVPLAGITASQVLHPVSLGIVAGLVIGKQAGIFLLSWLAVRCGIASLPRDVSWGLIYGASLLCGIGFTMSLFIASLAFEQGGGAYLGLERIGILAGSAIAGAAGYLALRRQLRAR